MFVLRTDRLVLRDFQESDLVTVRRILSDPEVVRHTEFQPNDESCARSLLNVALQKAAGSPRTGYLAAVCLAGTDEVMGIGSLMVREETNRCWELGYMVERRHWGSGYAPELARALISFGFGPLALHRIVAYTNAENPASIRVMEKLGFRREGLHIKDRLEKGHWRDSLAYATLAEEWV